MSENLKLWNKYRTPHRDSTKSFTRGGGFKGTAIDPMWLIRAATEVWGPMGGKWGIDPDSVTDQFIELNDGIVLHISRFTLYYPNEDNVRTHTLPCVGQTYVVAQFKDKQSGKYYLKADEEAPKKSMTDGLSKGLSWLGFAADVYMGMFDGNKYLDLQDEDNTPSKETPQIDGACYDEPTPGKKTVHPLAVTEAQVSKNWTRYEVVCKECTFSTFKSSTANACFDAMKIGAEIMIEFVEKNGYVVGDIIS